MIEDLSNPDIWFKEADPKQHKAVEVTEEDLTHAVTVMVTKKKYLYPSFFFFLMTFYLGSIQKDNPSTVIFLF